MRQTYVSTRGYRHEGFDFLDAVRIGLAPDGGLFVPTETGTFSVEELSELQSLSYIDRAIKVLGKFPLGRLTDRELRDDLTRAYDAKNWVDGRVAPIRKLRDRTYLLDLTTGPTAAFKDLALQLTPKLFTRAVTAANDNSNYLILAATSGDTGIATVNGYRDEPRVKVMVLYPADGVSIVQRQQMLAAVGANVHIVGIDGDFDACQSAVKAIFADTALAARLADETNTKLSSANSINWGRLIPQVAYYVSAYLDLVTSGAITLGDLIDVTVPSGNFGNILAAYYAKKIGLPLGRLIVASNANNVLTEFITTGTYDAAARTLITTASPSIDILKSSNVERLLYLVTDGDTARVALWMRDLTEQGSFTVDAETRERLQRDFSAGWVNEADCLAEVRDVYAETSILLDTHTAIATHIARAEKGDRVMLIAETADWGKFAPAIARAFGIDDEGKSIPALYDAIIAAAPEAHIHPRLAGLADAKIVHTTTLPADIATISEEVVRFAKELNE